MGLFKSKKEAVQKSVPMLPELPPTESELLDQSEIPDVPPGLPEAIETKILPEPPRPSASRKRNEGMNSFAMASQKPAPYEFQEPADFNQQKGHVPETYPFAEPVRRKEIHDVPEPQRIKEIGSDYEASESREFDNYEKPVSRIPSIRQHSDFQESYKHQERKAAPVFIRLDKFETTIEAFEEIKGKMIEIEDLLKKTKEVKAKEEEELMNWEKEMQIIKTKIDSIDKNVFSKLD